MVSESKTKYYKVLINHEEQYGIYPLQLDNPDGWREAGFAGREEECMQYVDEHWKDMRPLSARS